jgi:WS/DGAT/MGAT family acyltransferase
MQQLSGQDAMFLHAELKGLPQHIGGVSIYDQSTAPGGIVRFKDILAIVENRMHLSPIFTRKLQDAPGGWDNPYWVEDPHFDIEYHVRHIALPKPGDWRQLCIMAARIHSQPLDRRRPLWEMYVIGGLDNVEGLPKGCFAVLTKVHHAAMDGATGALFAAAIHDLSPEVRVYDKQPPRTVHNVSRFELAFNTYKNTLRMPGQLWQFARSSLPTWRRIQEGKKNNDFHTLDDKQATRFQGKITPHRVIGAVKFDFDDVRAIKNAVSGATVNDAMLTIVAGAMRKYLDAKGELPEQTLVAGCPIDVRSDSERESGGNMVGFMNVALRTEIADPLARLEAVHSESQSAKAYAEALGPRIMMDVTDVVPGGVIALAIRAASATGLSEATVTQNTVVTNVPGPPMQLYFAGAALADAISLGPLLPNMGLFQIVYSSVINKKGSITLSFTACRDMMPDPEFYAKCVRESFTELQAAVNKVQAKSKPRTKTKAKAKAKAKARTKAKTKAKTKPETKAKAKAKKG